MFRLHPEQGYVHEIAGTYEIKTDMRYHTVPTKTCDEKAALLGWPSSRVVKALYLCDGNGYIGLVTPETGQPIDFRAVLAEGLGITKNKAGRYRFNGTPAGMTYGTCTPFILESSAGKQVSKIIIADPFSLKDTVVDISVGGETDDAFLTSMHIPYDAIHEILYRKFGEGFVKKQEQ
ncbi:MAG: hypothetical protein JW716_03855 [Candidatus Aenigmarchaeota archaeon]|nr:hypothetical protein [Candidatus Aenigmarchaeota archaeon]